MTVEGRIATEADAAELAAMNQQLIRDEGHRNPMSSDQLQERMTVSREIPLLPANCGI